MIAHYFATALRNLARRPLNTAIKLLALALGLACLLTAHVIGDYFRQADRQWAKAERTYIIDQQLRPPGGEWQGGGQTSSVTLARYLRAEFPELETVAQMSGNFPLTREDGTWAVTGLPVEPQFLDIFDLEMVAGAADLVTPRSVLLSESRATSLYGDEDPIGRTLTSDGGLDLTVTGVFRDFPAASHLGIGGQMYLHALPSFDSWAANMLAQNPDQPRWWEEDNFFRFGAMTYVTVREDAALQEREFNRRLQEFAARRVPAGPYEVRFRAVPMSDLTEIRFNQRAGMPEGISLVVALYVLGAMTLAIGCINFANLSAAEAATRAPEIGLRKTIGAHSRQIAALALVESLMLATAALLLVLPITALIASAVTSRFGVFISLPEASRLDYWIGVALIAAAAAVAAGCYPALMLARLRPLLAIRMTSLRGRSLVRTLLIGAQFATAGMLIVMMIVMLAQNATMRAVALRPGQDPIVSVPIPNQATAAQQEDMLETVRRQLLASPSITGVAYRNVRPFSTMSNAEMQFAQSLDPAAAQFAAQGRYVYYDYFDTLGVDIVAGRDLERGRDESRSALIDVGTARVMGYTPQEAIGQPIYRLATPNTLGVAQQSEPSIEYTIIGVVEREPLDLEANGAANYVYVHSLVGGLALVRLSRENVEAGLAHIRATWERFAGSAPNAVFLDADFQQSYAAFHMITFVFVALSAIAAAIASMGLFGMASFVAQRRLKEFAVRKTLGASGPRVLGLMLWDFSKPVIVANLIAWPLAFVAARFYLNLFVTRIELTPLPFVLALAASLLVAWVAVSSQALRAARVKPALVLKTE